MRAVADPARRNPFLARRYRLTRMTHSKVRLLVRIAVAEDEEIAGAEAQRQTELRKSRRSAFEGVVQISDRGPFSLVGKAGQGIEVGMILLPRRVAHHVERLGVVDAGSRLRGDAAVERLNDKVFLVRDEGGTVRRPDRVRAADSCLPVIDEARLQQRFGAADEISAFLQREETADDLDMRIGAYPLALAGSVGNVRQYLQLGGRHRVSLSRFRQ